MCPQAGLTFPFAFVVTTDPVCTKAADAFIIVGAGFTIGHLVAFPCPVARCFTIVIGIFASTNRGIDNGGVGAAGGFFTFGSSRSFALVCIGTKVGIGLAGWGAAAAVAAWIDIGFDVADGFAACFRLFTSAETVVIDVASIGAIAGNFWAVVIGIRIFGNRLPGRIGGFRAGATDRIGAYGTLKGNPCKRFTLACVVGDTVVAILFPCSAGTRVDITKVPIVAGTHITLRILGIVDRAVIVISIVSIFRTTGA